MISVELKGHKELSKKLEWIQDNWPRVKTFAMMRMAEVLVDELDIDTDFIRYIKVEETTERTWYGVSLEPEPFEERPENIPDKLYFLVPKAGADSKIQELAEGNPYTADNLPIPLDSDQGIYLLRESTPDERAEARLRNLIYMDMNNINPADMSAEQPMQDDVKYNQSRGELGIGDSPRPPIWREGVKKLIQDRLPHIVDEVSELLIAGKIDESNLPDFEERSTEWLDANEDFMMIVAKV